MLLNDQVTYRMQWPRYADLQVNGMISSYNTQFCESIRLEVNFFFNFSKTVSKCSFVAANYRDVHLILISCCAFVHFKIRTWLFIHVQSMILL